MKLIAFALTLAAIAIAPAAAAAQRPAGGEVHVVKSSFSSKEKIDVAWSGFATGEVWFWIEPKGTPLTGQPHGPYHTSYDEAGRYALPNPGPGAWEIHWRVLGEDGAYSGGEFTVGAAAGVRRVTPGHYGCYTTTTFGLTRSSMQFIKILSKNRYRALGRTGKYRYNRRTATIKLTSGPLRKRVAQFRADASPQTIVFLRRQNEVGGKPTIDTSDTHCYRGEE